MNGSQGAVVFSLLLAAWCTSLVLFWLSWGSSSTAGMGYLTDDPLTPRSRRRSGGTGDDRRLLDEFQRRTDGLGSR